MQTLLPYEAERFVESERRLIVDFGLEDNLYVGHLSDLAMWERRQHGNRTSSAPSRIMRSMAICTRRFAARRSRVRLVEFKRDCRRRTYASLPVPRPRRQHRNVASVALSSMQILLAHDGTDGKRP